MRTNDRNTGTRMTFAPIFPSRRLIDGRLLLLSGLFLVYAVFAVGHLLDVPGLPGDLRESASRGGIGSIDGIPVRTSDEVEFVLSARSIGSQVEIAPAGGGGGPRRVTLVRYHPAWFLVIDLLVVSVVLGLGVVVALFHGDREVSGVFTGASLALATALLGAKTLYAVRPEWLGAALCGCFFLAYCAIPALFLHFAAVFPVKRFRDTRPAVRLLYAGAAIMAAWQFIVYLGAAREHSIGGFRGSVAASVWMNGFMVAGIISGLVVMVGSYRSAETLPDRKKSAWVLYGLALGTLPFVLLWALPQMFERTPLIPEFLFKLFLLCIPASFAIAILRYRLVDITMLITRSAVHAIVIGVLIVLYALLIGAAVSLVPEWTPAGSLLLSAAAAVLAAVAYDAVRGRARRFVDRTLFRPSFDFRGSLREVLDGLKDTHRLEDLASRLVDGVDRLLPVDRIGYFTLAQPGDRLRPVAEKNFSDLRTRGVRFEAGRLKTRLDLPVALDDHIEKSVRRERADADVFGRWGISLALPLKSADGEVLGFLVLGRKTSGLMFTEEDVDLLTVVAGHAAGEHERINLQRHLRMEQAEAERLDELSRLKSYFVSSVSHDLRTPLTSIRMFAELLRSKGDLPGATADEYLRIIEGESERLTRLIDNVLSFAKIERGIKEYRFRDAELNDIVSRLLSVMQYQFRIEKCEPVFDPAEGVLGFSADPDAVLEALMNLVGNSLKYSGDGKSIRITTFTREGSVGVSVADNGFGIAAGDLGAIFEPFRRGVNAGSDSRGGAGLGLSVVKHVVEAHGGVISVESEPGKGSTFTMLFPVEHTQNVKGEPA
jgi:signal transduction histidine kinase